MSQIVSSPPPSRRHGFPVRPSALLRPGRDPRPLRSHHHRHVHPGAGESGSPSWIRPSLLFAHCSSFLSLLQFFRPKEKEESLYTDLSGQDAGGYAPLMRDKERPRNRRVADDSTYTDLTHRNDGGYKELPIKKDRQRKNEQVYQGLSSATRDTYDALQMQPLPAR
uniref:CD247 antigen like n=1 Tax=Salarias fasciatus TaxID=181472 RepID=A0A672HUJ1_SALFA